MPLRQVFRTLCHGMSGKPGAAHSPGQHIADRVCPTPFRDGYCRCLGESGFKPIGDRRRVRCFYDQPDDRQDAGVVEGKILTVRKEATQAISRIVSRIRREIDQRNAARRVEGDIIGGYLVLRTYLQTRQDQPALIESGQRHFECRLRLALNNRLLRKTQHVSR